MQAQEHCNTNPQNAVHASIFSDSDGNALGSQEVAHNLILFKAKFLIFLVSSNSLLLLEHTSPLFQELRRTIVGRTYKRDKLNGTNGFLRKSAGFCGFLRKSAVSCGFLRKSAPPKCCNSQEKRKSAKICKKKLRI